MQQPLLDTSQVIEIIESKNISRAYGAMYSSWYGGIVTEPSLMMIPVDDHMVHRGDAVFEAFKFVHGAFFDLDKHIERLFVSAEFISLDIPWSRDEIVDLCKQTMKASGLKNSLIRLYVSRGPGDFSVNPYSTAGPQLYIVATAYNPVAEEKYSEGASLIKSSVPVKPHFFSRVKSCNYMQNVLMKKESVDRSADFAVNFTTEGELCEGPTENILVLTSEGVLCAPEFNYTLKGTTLMIVLELARKLEGSAEVVKVTQKKISEEEMWVAQEIMMVGTTLEVLPVTQYEGQAIAKGRPGPVAKKLRELLTHDMKTNSERRIEL